jgi:multicomponent Na+:H+ antiporter subunit B
MHESRGAKMASMRVAGRSLRATEVLGLLIFILMAVVMLAVGAALFCDWLAEPGAAPAGTPVELGTISEGLWVAGAIPAVALVIGVEVIGALSLIALYMLSSVRRAV